MPSPSLLQGLKERKLVQWAVAYLAGAWVLYEVTATVGGAWNLPDAVLQGLFVVLAIGFLITLIFAWYHGEKGRQRVSGPELLMVAGLLVIAGVALSVLPGGEHLSEPTGTAVLSAVEDGRPAIAVLPLDNFSPNPEDAYFADGVHEEIISKLSKISALRVISRNSVMGYREERKPTRQIARELGVSFILEGSARIGGGVVRVTLQLIDGRTDEHLWAEDYDRPYSLEGFIPIQSEVAFEVASRIRAEISPEEQARMARTVLLRARMVSPPAETHRAQREYLVRRLSCRIRLVT